MLTVGYHAALVFPQFPVTGQCRSASRIFCGYFAVTGQQHNQANGQNRNELIFLHMERLWAGNNTAGSIKIIPAGDCLLTQIDPAIGLKQPAAFYHHIQQAAIVALVELLHMWCIVQLYKIDFHFTGGHKRFNEGYAENN